MYTLEQLSEMLGVSKPTLYNRMDQFNSILDGHLRKGEHNTALITETGRKILERIEELRKEKFSIKQIEAQLVEELGMSANGSPNHVSADSQLLYKTVEILERENEFLKERVRKLESGLDSKDGEITRLHEIIQNRLPALPTGQNGQQPGRWERQKQFIRGR